MAISHSMTGECRYRAFKGEFDLDTGTADVYKMALYTDAASLGIDTSAYTTSGEVVGTGYTAGGATLSINALQLINNVACVDFNNPQWPTATFTARGAMIYKEGGGNYALAVIDFGANKSVSNSLFEVVLPPVTDTTAIIRFA